ncbi:hypothetical protein [Nostoc sp.]|uniref:hypothetical protein n=1 Tax=Nostoc sp. TaxID=1180 RepID=UPI002FF29F22
MSVVKQLDLLDEVKKRHPDGVIEGRRKRNFVTLIELGGQDFHTTQMVDLFKEYCKPAKEDALYIINLENIDVLTPSAARILVESAPDIASNCRIPVVFTNVRPMAKESLKSEACRFNPSKILWVIDEEGKADLIGQIPNKFQELLDFLEENGPASASKIALIQEGETSKKAVGNISVYLQKLFSAGLVGREKVTALDREDAERGWTYFYSTAVTIQRNSKPEYYIRRP